MIEAAGRGPVTAIGISKSGNMLVRLAVTAPSLVKRLVLIGTPLDVTPGSMSLVPSELDDRFRAALRAGDLERAMQLLRRDRRHRPGHRRAGRAIHAQRPAAAAPRVS